jgi:tRNA pseudouridine13 synthase
MTPAEETVIGITTYATGSAGVGGILKHRIEDFMVEEVTSREESDSGDYLIVEVEKRNWDTHKLIRDLSRSLRVSQNRFGWAGTKDKRAVTKQKLSIWKISEEDLKRVTLKDVSLKVVGRSNKKISLGDLYANRFQITLRRLCCSQSEAESRMERISGELREIGGAPNFFGVQRFGELRPVTHLVGRAIVEGDIEAAVMSYLTKTFPGESEEHLEARRYLLDTQDFSGSLRLYPTTLTFERAMLHHLAENPSDHLGALEKLSKNLQRMFVHAYQSYLFNRILSRRIEQQLPLNRAVRGDIVCFKNNAGLPDTTRLQRVTEHNLKGINNLIARGRAFVTAPLLGYDTPLSTDLPGEIEQEVMAEEHVSPEDFKLHHAPQYASKGLRREILITTLPLYQLLPDELHPAHPKAIFNFTLQKGSYATVLLREYMKSETTCTLPRTV